MTDQRTRIACVVVAHGDMSECLLKAVQGILGTQTGYAAVSNAGMGLPELMETVRKEVESLERTHQVILITDMPGGSCHHVCQAYGAERPELRVISGVNLMMLLEFFVKRDHTQLSKLA